MHQMFSHIAPETIEKWIKGIDSGNITIDAIAERQGTNRESITRRINKYKAKKK